MSTDLDAIWDASGRPISFFIMAGQISDYTGAAVLLDELPKAKWLWADRGYDAERFRDALQAKGITPCIPDGNCRNKIVKYEKRRYKRRNRIGIMFGHRKDWRRVATRYDRCPMAFFSAIALAASSSGSDQRVLSLRPSRVSLCRWPSAGISPMVPRLPEPMPDLLP